ncbi:MAG: cytochrome c oxidase accessory protein CcoG [Rickettsiales bacterium]|nr:cytochrome c oxidase accessory protein CcoG [Rickettsiales bacterium]
MSDPAPIQYFAKQEKVYPKRVWGRYRKIKWLVMIITLGIYYLAPFIRWDRGPNAPDQAILIDMAERRAYFFFIEIWPQEVYYLTGILILAAVALFFVTSLAGRIWCGYLCFQTVWTDLFVWVERIVQGDRNARKKLDESKWTIEKIWKKGATHITWLVIGLFTGGAWVFYFNDAPTLLEHIIHFDVPTAVLGWIIALTLSTYLMAGFAREQVCTYMCPYARFQSAMFDRDTLIISYDEKRGEKRGKFKERAQNPEQGDCIDCSLCVQVCPTGIDIRDGLQYECIACGLCVDACNGVMDKIGLERGLIRYDTTTNQEARDAGKPVAGMWSHILRLRTFYYVAIMALVGGIMLYSLLTRSPVELHVLHDRNPLFVKLADGSIRNGYEIKILNKTHEDKTYHLSIDGIEGASLQVKGAGQLSPESLPVFADSVGHFRVFVFADKQASNRADLTFELNDLATDASDSLESVFVSGK